MLHQHAVALVEAPAEAGEVGGAQPLLAAAVQDVEVVVGGHQLVGDAAGAVRGVVVDDQDVRGQDRRAVIQLMFSASL